jgi:hypothetical protein
VQSQVGRSLLLRGSGVLDRRLDVGHVESHITNVTSRVERAIVTKISRQTHYSRRFGQGPSNSCSGE